MDNLVSSLVKLLLAWGGWGLLLVVVILIIFYYERLEKPIARIYNLLSWIRRSWRRKAIQIDIQSNINSFSRSVEQEVTNSMPYKMKLDFVNEDEGAELLREQNTVLVRIHDRKHDDRNLVHAMLAFAPVGLLPAARPYMDETLSDAVDFITMRKLLSAMNHYSAVQYFDQEVVKPRIAQNPELNDCYMILGHLDEQGLFTKVVLRELRDFGIKVGNQYPTPVHKKETKQLVDYLKAVASRQPGVRMAEIGCIGNYISIGFLFVGTLETMAAGTDPYINHINRLKALNLERIYIAARDTNIPMAEKVSLLAENNNLAKRIRSQKYYASDNTGTRRQHILIEMSLKADNTSP